MAWLENFLASKSQILIIGIFLVILVGIPVATFVIKQSQESRFGSSGTTPTTEKNQQQTEGKTQGKEVPATSPLEELSQLLRNEKNDIQTPENEEEPASAPPAGTTIGPILSFKINLEGRAVDKQTAKAFIGIASGTKTSKPAFLLTFSVDIPDSGSFTGLSLAGLETGSVYTVYIKGPVQIDTASTFTMNPTGVTLNNGSTIELLSGDLNEDNTINSTDYTIVKNIYGKTESSAEWNERADLNRDGIINNLDLSYITKNIGKTGDSGVWYSPVPVATSSAKINSKEISVGGYEIIANPKGGYWLWVPPVD